MGMPMTINGQEGDSPLQSMQHRAAPPIFFAHNE
jgi:hypothetical protein